MTLDDFLEALKITEDNAEERIEQARHDFFGCFGWNCDYDCRPSGVTLNGMPSNPEAEIVLTWDEILDYVKQPKQITWF